MGKPATDLATIRKMRKLRRLGYSLPEIQREIGTSNTTILRYVRDVKISLKYQKNWSIKRGGSKKRAIAAWSRAREDVEKTKFSFAAPERMLIASMLYWGEGTKNNELALVNSDPALIQVFLKCLESFGVTKDMRKISIRIFEDMDREKCSVYWAKIAGVAVSDIAGVEIRKGRKKGKLEFGMCRVRVVKGAPYFKMLKSCIELVTQAVLSLP